MTELLVIIAIYILFIQNILPKNLGRKIPYPPESLIISDMKRKEKRLRKYNKKHGFPNIPKSNTAVF